MRHPGRIIVTDVYVLDPRNGDLSPSSDILLSDGRILDILPSGKSRYFSGRTLDGNGRVAVPGLIDCHLHVCGIYLTGQPTPADLTTVPGQVLKNLRALIDSGVTTARDMAGPLKLELLLRHLAARGTIASPRLLVPGPIFAAPGGYPYFIDPLRPPVDWAVGQLKAEVDTPEDARRWVNLLADRRVDLIKVAHTCAEYDDKRSPLPAMQPEVFSAITEQAHRRGLRVAAHHIWATDLDTLLTRPFDTLEHLSIDALIQNPIVDQIRKRALPVTTTLMTYGIIDFIDELEELLVTDDGYRFEERPRAALLQLVRAIQNNEFQIPHIGRKVIETGMKYMLENLKLLKKAGVAVGAGTDSGGAITPCGKITWELRSFLRAGLTPLEALRAATCDAAQIIGHPELGVLEPGRPADLVLCPDNPADDLAALEQVNLVIRDGMVFKNDLSAGGG